MKSENIVKTSEHKVKIIRFWHDTSKTIGYAEGTINGREFTASWASWEPLGGLFYDTWLDTTPLENKTIKNTLLEKGAIPIPTL